MNTAGHAYLLRAEAMRKTYRRVVVLLLPVPHYKSSVLVACMPWCPPLEHGLDLVTYRAKAKGHLFYA